ncbi:beta strand repeat-containing protein [Criblamydia sequanensis]|uniref:Secreted protein n=1 Tax=Candidatus Criblamydia sequanensis CRIB-18 TaxID=1437425 RepID=A0A090DWU7_9BACT|nr:Ig-like domain-containing protein [Criblamydia sequanensis]CDR33314.1 putative secreted protein [Criblamydia sequanensis CRIB-18]
MKNISRCIHLFLHAVFILLASQASSAWDLPVTEISTTTTFNQDPDVAMALNSTNEGLATWTFSSTNLLIQASKYDGSTWSAPVTISVPGEDADQSKVGMDSTGKGHAVWRRFDGPQTVIQTAAFDGTTWGAPINLSLTGQNALNPQISVNASNHAMAVWTRSNGVQNVTQAAYFDGTTWGAPVTINTPGLNSELPQVSLNSTDRALAVWEEPNGLGDVLIQAAFFNGTTWDAPVQLSSTGFNSSNAQVSLNDSNIGFATWILNNAGLGEIQAAPFNGTTWDAAETIIEPGSTGYSPKIEVWPSGNAVAVWINNDFSSERVKGTIYSSGSWGAVDTFGDQLPNTEVVLGVNSTNIAYASWLSFAPFVNVVRAAVFNGSTWAPQDTLTSEESYATSIAVNPSGRALVVLAKDSDDVGIFATESTGEDINSNVVATPPFANADGIDFSTITVTLINNGGAPIVGNTVSLAANGGSSVISAPSGPSDASGQVTFTVTDTVIEDVTYTATDETNGIVIVQTATVSFLNEESFFSTVEASPTSVLNNGSSSSTITVTLTNGTDPIVGSEVSLSQGGGSSSIFGPSGPSDALGQVFFTVTNTTAEVVTYTATDTTTGNVIAQTAQVTFFADESTTSTVTASPLIVMSDGVQASTITVTLLDNLGVPIVGNNVSLSQGGGSSIISPPSGASDAFGQVTFTVTNTQVETVTYTATDTTNAVVIFQTAQVSFETNEESASTVVAAPTSVNADGSQSSTITVTLLDDLLNPIVGNTVSLSQGGGSSSISPPSGVSNAFGQVTFTVTNTTPETVTYTARDNTNGIDLQQTAQVTFIALESNTSTVTAFPLSVISDGVSFSTITVTLLDGFLNPIVGHTVSLAQNGSSVISAPSGPSDAFGQVTFTVTNINSETVTYTATDVTNGVIITQTAQVAFGDSEAGLSTVIATPASVEANGVEFSTITVTLLNGALNPIVGNSVSLSQGGGSSIISPLVAVTNAFGQAQFIVRSTTEEVVTYTATDITNAVLITQTAEVTFTEPLGPLPPTNFRGQLKKNKFATQTEYYDLLEWDPSPDINTDHYEIYQNGVLKAVVPATGPFKVAINNVNKNLTYIYTLYAVDIEGDKSAPVVISVP